MNSVLKPVFDVLLVGLGTQALDTLAPCVLEVPRFNLIAGVDPNRSRRALFESQYQRPAFGSLQDSLDWQQPDIACVAIPHVRHKAVADTCIERGVAVLKEKPYAVTLDEALHLRELEHSSGIPIETLLYRRYQYAYQCLKDILPLLGRLQTIEMTYCLGRSDPGMGWRADLAEAGGGCIIDMGYHIIDLAIWYLGTPRQIHAVSQCISGHDACQHHPEASAEIKFIYDSFPMINISLARVGPQKIETILVAGERGTARLEGGELKIHLVGHYDRTFGRLWGSEVSIVRQMNEFCRTMDGVRDGIHTPQIDHVAVIQACYESTRTHSPVNVHEEQGG